ncbi:DUF3784 domain-containing protein [Alkalicella caledoniensis]|uniref:DUF3784 domain-containing protein n=1 Tax=Alkalicella caledoniensis TaxID=2731377 RepID=A0A7G9W693_ALKCA|nr:DUF3784 domain-containing protein [Alkalicella caledoniensis]QNO14205.1 DUF3784 domain-containing protein [Alkalicella caledoniensis]
MWVYFMIAATFLLMGMAIVNFKWYFLIAGYNTMSKEQQEKVEIKKVANIMGIYSYANGAVFLALGILNALGIKAGMTVPLIFFGVSTVCMLIIIQKYDRNRLGEKGVVNKESKGKQLITIIFTGVIFLGVGVLMIYSSQPAKISFEDEGVKIHGIYGRIYAWDSIEEVKLLDELPQINRRTNGSAIGPHKKGNFDLEGYGSARLHVDERKSPFIYMESNGRIVIFNAGNSALTEEIYKGLVLKNQ